MSVWERIRAAVQGFLHPAVAAAQTNYRGAERSRLWKDWLPNERSGDAAIYEDYPLLNARLRDLFRNEPLMRKLRCELAKGVIGSEGIQTFAEVMLDDLAPGQTDVDDKFNDEADDLFELWCEEADAEGKFCWSQLQWQHFYEVTGLGGGLLVEVWDDNPRRLLPLSYQLIEYDQLDVTKDQPAINGQNRIVRGIEFDRRNRVVAYHIYDVHPHDNWATTAASTRVPASRVIHTFFPDRPSQNVGVSLFSANVQPAKDLDWYLGNELTAAAIGALFSVMIKRDRGAGSGLGFVGDNASNESSDSYGNSLARLGRGILFDGGPNDDVKIIQSGRPNGDASAFIELILRQAGQAIGLSLARVTGDYKATSYSAGRAMHLDDEAYFRVLRRWFGYSCVVPVRRRFTQVAAAMGLFRTVGARQFLKNERRMLRVDCIGVGREQLDPEKETTAAHGRIRGCTSTYKIECALRGLHYRKVFRQRAREQALLEELGLEPDLSVNGKAAAEEPDTDTEDMRNARAA